MDIWDSAKEIANKLLDSKHPIRLISHNDADGISSSAIMALSLSRENKNFHLSNVKGFNHEIKAIAHRSRLSSLQIEERPR